MQEAYCGEAKNDNFELKVVWEERPQVPDGLRMLSEPIYTSVLCGCVHTDMNTLVLSSIQELPLLSGTVVCAVNNSTASRLESSPES